MLDLRTRNILWLTEIMKALCYPNLIQQNSSKVLRFKNCELSTVKSENTVFLEDVQEVFVIQSIVKLHEQVHLIGRRSLKKMNCKPIP